MKSTAKFITSSALVLALLLSGTANANDRMGARFENQSTLTLSAPETRQLTRVLVPMPAKAPMPQKYPIPQKHPMPTKMPNPTKVPTPWK